MDSTGPAMVPDVLIAAIRRKVDQINAIDGEEIRSSQADQDVVTLDYSIPGYATFFDDCLSGNERVHRLHCMLRGELVPVDLPGLVQI